MPGSSGTPLASASSRAVCFRPKADRCSRAWADEGDAFGREPLGKADILREEAVAGMHGLGARRLAGGDDGIDVEIAFAGRRRAEAHGLVGEQRRPW